MSTVVYTRHTEDGVTADVVKGWTSDFQRRAFHVRLGGHVFSSAGDLETATYRCDRLVNDWNVKHTPDLTPLDEYRHPRHA